MRNECHVGSQRPEQRLESPSGTAACCYSSYILRYGTHHVFIRLADLTPQQAAWQPAFVDNKSARYVKHNIMTTVPFIWVRPYLALHFQPRRSIINREANILGTRSRILLQTDKRQQIHQDGTLQICIR